MTKLYLHREGVGTLPSGTLPSGEQSSLTADSNLFDNEDGSENRLMDSTISAQSQTTLTNTSTADTNAHNYYIARWVSPKLNMTSISANTWNLKFSATESNTNANFPRNGAGALRICIYAWKPSDGTKYGNILDGNTATDFEEAGTSQTLIEGTFSGSAVSSLTANDVVIVFELWAIVTQSMGIGYTQTVQYDGTTESSTSNNAAFIETPQTLTFSSTLFERTINENAITTTDSITKSALKIRSITENSITTNATITKMASKFRSMTETITTAATLTKSALKLRSITENALALTDSITRFRVLPRSMSETLALSDSITKVKTISRSINETLALSDSITKVATKMRSMSESILTNDTITKIATKFRSMSEVITIIDSITRDYIPFQGGQLFHRTINETLTLADSITKSALKSRAISETLTLADSIVKSALKLRSMSESITIIESVTKAATKFRSMTESITLQDVVDRLKILAGGGQLFEIVINESITVSDSITKVLSRFFRVGGKANVPMEYRKKMEKAMKRWKPDYKKMLDDKIKKKFKRIGWNSS